jgi:hypothetical protein
MAKGVLSSPTAGPLKAPACGCGEWCQGTWPGRGVGACRGQCVKLEDTGPRLRVCGRRIPMKEIPARFVGGRTG